MRAGFSRSVSVLLLCLMASADASAQMPSSLDSLKSCAKIDDRNTRHDCYDTWGPRVLEEESGIANGMASTKQAVVGPAKATVENDTIAASKVDNIGGAKFQPKSDPLAGLTTSRITSCKQGVDGRWHFFFENGQVWKQVNDSRLVFKGCDVLATISKDGFGYRLAIDGRKRKIRVTRRK